MISQRNLRAIRRQSKKDTVELKRFAVKIHELEQEIHRLFIENNRLCDLGQHETSEANTELNELQLNLDFLTRRMFELEALIPEETIYSMKTPSPAHTW